MVSRDLKCVDFSLTVYLRIYMVGYLQIQGSTKNRYHNQHWFSQKSTMICFFSNVNFKIKVNQLIFINTEGFVTGKIYRKINKLCFVSEYR